MWSAPRIMDAILSYKKRDEDDYYVILGCDELSSVEQIQAEYKMRARKCHPDKHPGDPEAAEKFSRLQVAKETLADPNKRTQYDHWRCSGMAMRYEEWCAKKNSIHASMHWATKAKKEAMIEPAQPVADELSKNVKWEQQQLWNRPPANDALRQFRNYNI